MQKENKNMVLNTSRKTTTRYTVSSHHLYKCLLVCVDIFKSCLQIKYIDITHSLFVD